MAKDTPPKTTMLLAILAVITTGFCLAGMDAVAKALMTDYPPVQIIWGRYIFTTVLVAAFLVHKNGWTILVPQKPLLQSLRGGCLLLVTAGIYFAIQTISLADATAVMFFAPVLVTLFAGIFLKEPVGKLGFVAVILGFLGVLIIVRPGFASTDPALFLAVLAAFSLAFYFLLTRLLHGQDRPGTTLFHSTAIGTVLLTCMVPFFWHDPDLVGWGLMIATGLLGAMGHFFLIKGFSLVPASTLSPFLNAQLVAATLYSYVFFQDPLDVWFFLGSGLIVIAGLVVWWRER